MTWRPWLVWTICGELCVLLGWRLVGGLVLAFVRLLANPVKVDLASIGYGGYEVTSHDVLGGTQKCCDS